MGDLGKLWFSLGLKDETDNDYDKVKKKNRRETQERARNKGTPEYRRG